MVFGNLVSVGEAATTPLISFDKLRMSGCAMLRMSGCAMLR